MESLRNNETELKKLENEIEALLFASDAPLSAGRLSSMTDTASLKSVKNAIKALEGFYREHNRSFGVVEIAGGYQLVTLPEYESKVALLFKSRRKTKLSQAALETLAIVAYKQPVSRISIEAIRGVNCDGVLSTLIDKELITITGRGKGIGKPYLYSTTNKFLEYLGLRDYRDLPSAEELEKNIERISLIPQPSDFEPVSELNSAAEINTGIDNGDTETRESDSEPEDNSSFSEETNVLKDADGSVSGMKDGLQTDPE